MASEKAVMSTATVGAASADDSGGWSRLMWYQNFEQVTRLTFLKRGIAMTSFRSVIGATILSCVATMANAQVVGVATNPQGSLYYSAGAAVAGVIQQKAGITARVQPCRAHRRMRL